MSSGSTDNTQPANDEQTSLFCLALDGKGATAPFDTDGAQQWIHLDYSAPDAISQLAELGIAPTVIDSLVRTDTRPRAIAFEEGVLLSLRAVNFSETSEPEDMVSLRLWIEPSRIVSLRQRRVYSIQEIRTDLESARGPRTLDDVVLAIIEHLTDRISRYVDRLNDQLDQLEQALQDGAYQGLRNTVSSIRRRAATVRRYLAPQREALETFIRIEKNTLNESQLYELREQSDRIARYVEDIDLVREQALVLQEQLLNITVEQQNARMYVLALITAVFLPITFITGVFGMNVGGLPGIEAPRGFFNVMITTLIIAGAVLALFRWRRWF